jgi:hypothetical protein
MLIVSILIHQKVQMPVLFDRVILVSLGHVFLEIYNKLSRLRRDKSQFLQTFVRRIAKIINNQLTVKKMMGRERNLDCGIKRYRETILDTAETFLRFFGFDRSVYSNFKKTK